MTGRLPRSFLRWFSTSQSLSVMFWLRRLKVTGTSLKCSEPFTLVTCTRCQIGERLTAWTETLRSLIVRSRTNVTRNSFTKGNSLSLLQHFWSFNSLNMLRMLERCYLGPLCNLSTRLGETSTDLISWPLSGDMSMGSSHGSSTSWFPMIFTSSVSLRL